jgi:hypothetical protein
MASGEEELCEFAKDPVAYAEETGRLAEELQDYIFPPWRWPGWYRRRRVVEERLRILKAFAPTFEESEREGG